MLSGNHEISWKKQQCLFSVSTYTCKITQCEIVVFCAFNRYKWHLKVCMIDFSNFSAFDVLTSLFVSPVPYPQVRLGTIVIAGKIDFLKQ